MKKVLFGLCCMLMMSCGSDYSACDSGAKVDMVGLTSPDLLAYSTPDLSANVDMSWPDDMRKPIKDLSAPPPDMVKFCGNAICESDETCSSCETDCGKCPPICGNSKCEAGETCESCSADCGACKPKPKCGDGVCSSDETCSTCPCDCGKCSPPTPICGNGKCETGETCETCACDCGSCCGKH